MLRTAVPTISLFLCRAADIGDRVQHCARACDVELLVKEACIAGGSSSILVEPKNGVDKRDFDDEEQALLL